MLGGLCGGRRHSAHVGSRPSTRYWYSRRTERLTSSRTNRSGRRPGQVGPLPPSPADLPHERRNRIGSGRCTAPASSPDDGNATSSIAVVAVRRTSQRHPDLVLDLVSFEDDRLELLRVLDALLVGIETRKALRHDSERILSLACRPEQTARIATDAVGSSTRDGAAVPHDRDRRTAGRVPSDDDPASDRAR